MVTFTPKNHHIQQEPHIVLVSSRLTIEPWGASMVGVHQLLAVQASHGASALSQVLNWLHWQQTLLAALIAIVISWMSLLAGFHQKGRPFGSRKAKIHTIALIIVTT